MYSLGPFLSSETLGTAARPGFFTYSVLKASAVSDFEAILGDAG